MSPKITYAEALAVGGGWHGEPRERAYRVAKGMLNLMRQRLGAPDMTFDVALEQYGDRDGLLRIQAEGRDCTESQVREAQQLLSTEYPTSGEPG